MTWLVKLELSLECGSFFRLVSILRSKIWVGLLQVKIVWFKLIIFLTLIFGWKNEKQPSGPIELDLEAGNLVSNIYNDILIFSCIFYDLLIFSVLPQQCH